MDGTLTRRAAYSLPAEAVRDLRKALGLSAAAAARLVGLSDGAAWRAWERAGVTGPAAKLLEALRDDAEVRRYFGLG